MKLSKFTINRKKEFEEVIFTQSLSDREFITNAKKIKIQKRKCKFKVVLATLTSKL